MGLFTTPSTLTPHGYDVILSTDGEEALKIVQNELPAVILLLISYIFTLYWGCFLNREIFVNSVNQGKFKFKKQVLTGFFDGK